MRGLAVLSVVVGLLLLGAGGVGVFTYLNPEARLPASYRSLPGESSTRREALLTVRRSGAAQAYLAGMGGAVMLLLGANLWVLLGVRDRLLEKE